MNGFYRLTPDEVEGILTAYYLCRMTGEKLDVWVGKGAEGFFDDDEATKFLIITGLSFVETAGMYLEEVTLIRCGDEYSVNGIRKDGTKVVAVVDVNEARGLAGLGPL